MDTRGHAGQARWLRISVPVMRAAVAGVKKAAARSWRLADNTAG
jgi:hypothetical protein